MNSLVTIMMIAWVLFLSPRTPSQSLSLQERQLLFEKRAVAEMRQIPMSDLDVALPKLPFADWFEKVVGPGAGVRWQLAECADARTEAHNGIRACVEISAILLDGRLVTLRITVGTFKQGRIGAPKFCFGAVEWKRELHLVSRLRDLPKLLWSPGSLSLKPAIKLPELNMPRVRLAANNEYMTVAMAWNEEEISLPLTLDAPPPPEPPPVDSVALTKPLSATESQGALIQGGAIYKVQPTYPPNAKIFSVSGTVKVRITISAEGRVKAAVAASGHPLLRDAAVEAARKWVFKPTTVNSLPVETQLVLTFDFSPR